MAGNTKAIKSRIKSVKNTKKITKAMEMVSAAKMRKAIDGALRTRVYASLAGELLDRLSYLPQPGYALFAKRPVEKVLLIVVSSNKGLCGSFNANVFKKGTQVMQELTDSVHIDVIGIGKKSALFAKRNNLPLVAVFDDISEQPEIEDILTIAKMAVSGFTTEKYDQVLMLYTHFQSSLVQQASVKQLLPVSQKTIQTLAHGGGLPIELRGAAPISIEHTYIEPNKEIIFEKIVPKLVDIQLYQSILESAASEHSARMVAMKNATEAAGDMITNLSIAFNKARQAAITQEIAEIAGGAAALE